MTDNAYYRRCWREKMIKNSQLLKVIIKDVTCKLDAMQEFCEDKDILLMTLAAMTQIQAIRRKIYSED